MKIQQNSYISLFREKKKKLKEDPTIYYITISLVIFNITYIQLDFDHVQIDTRFIWIQDNPIVCILWIHTHAKLAVTWTDCTIYESDRRNFISIELLPSNCPSPPFVPAFLHKYRICLLSLSCILSYNNASIMATLSLITCGSDDIIVSSVYICKNEIYFTITILWEFRLNLIKIQFIWNIINNKIIWMLTWKKILTNDRSFNLDLSIF